MRVENWKVGDKVLVTTDGWFYAPDGESYRAVFGTLVELVITEEKYGIKNDKNTAKWALKIGNMLIAGCRIHYIVKTDKCNGTDGPTLTEWSEKRDTWVDKREPKSRIYFSDDK